MKNYVSTMKKFVLKKKNDFQFNTLKNVMVYSNDNELVHLASNKFMAIKWTQELTEDICLKTYGQSLTSGKIVQTVAIERTAKQLIEIFSKFDKGTSYNLELEKVVPLLKENKKEKEIYFYPNESIEIQNKHKVVMKVDGKDYEKIIVENVFKGERKLKKRILFDTGVLLTALETIQLQGKEFEIFVEEHRKQILIVSDDIEILVCGLREN